MGPGEGAEGILRISHSLKESKNEVVHANFTVYRIVHHCRLQLVLKNRVNGHAEVCSEFNGPLAEEPPVVDILEIF